MDSNHDFEKIYKKSFVIFDRLLKEMTEELEKSSGMRLRYKAPKKKNDFLRSIHEIAHLESGGGEIFTGWDNLEFKVYEHAGLFGKEKVYGIFYSEGMTKQPKLVISLSPDFKDKKYIIEKYVQNLERIFRIRFINTIN
jgi:hypothetical protein